MWTEFGVESVCCLIFVLASYVKFGIGNVHAEDRDLSPMGLDNDQFIKQLVKTVCDPLSSSFVLHGVGLDDLWVILNEHGIQPNVLIDLCCQALCHHILNGHCAKADREHCHLIVGHFPPGIVAQCLSSTMLDIILKPDFPLDVI